MESLKELFSSLKIYLSEISERPWRPVNSLSFVLGTLLACIIAWFANMGQRWIPILDGANLMFHEAGHPVLGMFPDRLEI